MTTTTDTPTSVSATFEPAPTPQVPALMKPTPSLGELLSGRPNLAKALCAAQQAAHSVAPDKTNAYHKYHYASAEAILTESRVLSANGLALIPLEETLDGWQRDGEERFQLICRYLLLHTSGESLPLIRHWPVCVEKGRPLDKATAAASTLSLSYLLRDLLLLARVAPADDVSARDDRPREQRREKPAGTPKKAPPANGEELAFRLQTGEAKTPGIIQHVTMFGATNGYPPDMNSWNAAQTADAWKAVAAWIRQAREGGITRPVSTGGQHAPSQATDADGGPEPDSGELIDAAGRKEIAAALKAANATWEWCRKLLELPEEASVADLTIAQAARLKAALQAKKAS